MRFVYLSDFFGFHCLRDYKLVIPILCLIGLKIISLPKLLKSGTLRQDMNRILSFIFNSILAVSLLAVLSVNTFAQAPEEGVHPVDAHQESEYDPANTAFHHISDQNIFSLGFYDVPLPMILYTPGDEVGS